MPHLQQAMHDPVFIRNMRICRMNHYVITLLVFGNY